MGKIIHGMEGSRFYGIWQSMKKRCKGQGKYNKEYYGHLGYDGAWEEFMPFMDDLYEKYLEHCNLHGEKNTSLDRIDNGKGYYKFNLRWATRAVQQRNQSRNINYTHNGKTQCLKDWSIELELNYKKVHQRFKKLGWTIERSLELNI